MLNEYIVRRAEPKDADEIAKMTRQWHSKGKEAVKENVKRLILEILKCSPNEHFLFVAEADGKVVAFAYWIIVKHFDWGRIIGELKTMFVDANYRRRGIARMLTLAEMKATYEVGASEYRLEDISPSNTPALSLYKTLGFKSKYTVDGYCFLDLYLGRSVEEDEKKEK